MNQKGKEDERKSISVFFQGVITSIVGCCESAEALLTSGVPDLQLDNIVFMLNGLQFEIDSNRVEKVFVKLVVCIAKQEA